MYLKEIEISGFKSFADKININLDNRITCIVGPNGSGKSNIVDAIRFVLGEQSVKSLRGDNLMSDVIFAGSKSRKGLHAASVALTFDNSDNYLKIPYSNVSVKRRLYKTGDNEYFLNGEKCRLKDIVDLFLDSTVSKNSFNIIGQGEIAKILSNSPYERRLVIEEAAGILKYKKRREEALKKLDKTNLNLDRVNDIIKEVEERVTPLKKQSERALEYLDIKEKLKNVEVALLVSEISEANIEYQDTKNQIKTLSDNILDLETKLTNPTIDKIKIENINMEKKLQEMNEKLVLLTKEREEINSNLTILKERSKYDAKDIKVHENIAYLKESKLTLENNFNLLNKELELKYLNKKNIENNLNSLIENLNTLTSKRETSLKEYNTKNKDMLVLENQIEILKNNIEENVYLNNNVRKILDNPKLTGILDVLLNIVKTDNIYENALEVMINGIKNFLIVEDEIAAKNAIDFLKINKLGRVTFLPINVIKPKYVDATTLNSIKNVPGYLGILSDFLKYEPRYQNIILNSFGNVLVVKNLEVGNQISKMIDNKYRIVSLDGDVIHVGGSITGGNLNSKSFANTKGKLQELELKANLNKNTIKTLEVDLNNMEKEIGELDKKIYDVRTNLIRVIDDIGILKNKIAFDKKNLDETIAELKSLTTEDNQTDIEEIEKQYYDKSLECNILEQDIANLLKEKDELQKHILETEGIRKENQLKLNSCEKELNTLNIKLSKLDTKLDSNLNILNNEYSLTYEGAKGLYALEIDSEFARKDVLEYKEKLKEIGMVNLDSINEYKEVNERYTYLTNERDDLLHAKELLYSIISEMDEVMQSEFVETFKELEVEFEKVFKEMFKGGTATLKLTSPDNILETGVEIIASPPGKKLKTITLLSGGEKTLTAISLLFAILNIRSVPFCIFDEVEAALDEANVDNFGKYLEHYEKKTQFLLITHKKRTMEYAKTLYGITMQESGVSKLVSVRLEDKI